MERQTKEKIMSRYTQAEIANYFGCKQQSVAQWFSRSIPSQRVIPLCEMLKWNITPHLLRPDIYPNPTDGIPADKQNTL
ncbi:YdaS family helix-turn-helix protein [Arsenophonus endosymbiont of Crataerina pallida]|uniref:YdaS family helix-turn-helix protein n=1 Tax=Arsenophonus endosymbiont of Crataerina pallida TaxID=3066235 RepID=UPI0030CAEF5B